MLIGLIIFAVAVTLSHAFFLCWMQRHKEADIETRKKLWRRHILLNGNLWRILFVWILAAQIYFFRVISLAFIPLAIIFLGLGFCLVLLSHLKLGGFQAGMGKRFFFPDQNQPWLANGIYRHLANPMYDGLILLLIGFGLLFGAVEDYYLAFISFGLLNVFLSQIESQAGRWRPF